MLWGCHGSSNMLWLSPCKVESLKGRQQLCRGQGQLPFCLTSHIPNMGTLMEALKDISHVLSQISKLFTTPSILSSALHLSALKSHVRFCAPRAESRSEHCYGQVISCWHLQATLYFHLVRNGLAALQASREQHTSGFVFRLGWG